LGQFAEWEKQNKLWSSIFLSFLIISINSHRCTEKFPPPPSRICRNVFIQLFHTKTTLSIIFRRMIIGRNCIFWETRYRRHSYEEWLGL
jgi:hypothetical protein